MSDEISFRAPAVSDCVVQGEALLVCNYLMLFSPSSLFTCAASTD